MQQKKIIHLKSADYPRLFMEKNFPENNPAKKVQVYDYRQLGKIMKTPTSVFIPDYNYLIYIKRGHISHQIDNQIRHIGKGSIVFMQSGQVAALLEVSPDIEGTIVIFEHEVLNEVFIQQSLLALFSLTPVLTLPKNVENAVAQLMQLLLTENDVLVPNTHYSVSLIQAIFQKLFEVPSLEKPVGRAYTVAVRFKELVYKHFAKSKKVSFYASKLAITENYLNRCVTEVLNTSAKKYIMTIVISQAKLHLLDVDKSVSDIAYTLNFEDASNFAKVFKSIAGLSPGAYKKTLSKL